MINETNQLSDREREILQLVATGLSNQQIANQLGISINTVKVHLRNVFGKIGVASRTEASMYAIRHGIVEMATTPAAASPTAVALPEVTPERGAPPIAESHTHTSNETPPVEAPTPAPLLESSPVVEVMASSEPAIVSQPVIRSPVSQRRWNQGLLVVAILLVLGIVVPVSVWALERFRSSGPPDGQPSASTASAEATRWQVMPNMPEPRAGFAVASIANQLYVIGGENEQGVLDTMQRYDVQFETWATLSRKPTAVTDVQAAVLGEKIYVPGGRRSNDPADVVKVFERYDPRTDSWEGLPDLPAPRSGYGLATAEGKLYVFGGWDGSMYRREVFMYDPSRAAWSELTSMPTARAFMGVAEIDASIYVLGGEDASGALAAVELYTPAREGDQPWSRRPPMPQARSRFGTAGVASFSTIYVFGGGTSVASLQYNTDTDRWQPMPAATQGVGSRPGVIEQDAAIIVLGGQPAAQQYSAIVQRYQALYTIPLPAP